MTEEEEWKYLKENKVDEEIMKLQNKYCEKYKALENKQSALIMKKNE